MAIRKLKYLQEHILMFSSFDVSFQVQIHLHLLILIAVRCSGNIHRTVLLLNYLCGISSEVTTSQTAPGPS